MMNVTLSNNLRTMGIDTSVLKEVSSEILKRAHAKTSQNVQQRAFTGAELGIDLYQGKVDNATARQIALNNSGLQIQLNENVMNSIKFLNAQAAQQVAKNVEGKIAFAVYEGADAQKAPEMPKFNSIVSFAISKDKEGSNAFYHGELLNNGNHQEENSHEDRNIFS